MVAEPLTAHITARTGASERGRMVLGSCRGNRCVDCKKLVRALCLVCATLACVLPSVRSSMTEQTVHDLVPSIAQKEDHMVTIGHAGRAQAAGNGARAAETASGGAGVRQGTSPTALVDTRLLGRTSDVQWRTRRLEVMAIHVHCSRRCLAPRREEAHGEQSRQTQKVRCSTCSCQPKIDTWPRSSSLSLSCVVKQVRCRENK